MMIQDESSSYWKDINNQDFWGTRGQVQLLDEAKETQILNSVTETLQSKKLVTRFLVQSSAPETEAQVAIDLK